MTNSFTRLRISLIITLLLGAMLTNVGHAWSIGANRQKTASVAGTVTDPSGAVVVDAKVSVKGSSFEGETATNGAGQYDFNLPPGLYSIEVRSTGFCRARRASFRALPQSKTTFDFALLICPSHGEGPMSYESFVLKSNSSAPSDFLIRFGKRSETTDTIEFEGALTHGAHYAPATQTTGQRQVYVTAAVTYDHWTMSATHLRLNKQTLRLELSGDVAILDGVQETRGKRAEVDFSLPRPVVNLTH
jgi:hypothetical protein